MKKPFYLLFLMLLLIINGCGPKVSTVIGKSYPLLDYRDEVIVIGLEEPEPANSEVLGEVKIGDSGFTIECDYQTVTETAKLEARKAGGNAIKITQHATPSVFGSNCHRITAKILRIKDTGAYLKSKKVDSISDVDYAVLNIYRYSGAGSLVGYDLYLEDSVICRVKNNFKTTIHIARQGLSRLWARTETKDEILIDFKHGRTYYLRCGLTMGILVGHPTLELIENDKARLEFESFKAKNK